MDELMANKITAEILGLKERLFKKIDLAVTIFGLLSILMTIIYLVFFLVMGFGNFFVNLASLILASLYAVFLFIFVFVRKGKLAKKIGKKTYKYFKLLINAVSLALSIYGLVVSANNPSFWSIEIVVLFAVILYFKIILEIISMVLRHQIKKVIRKRKQAKAQKMLGQGDKETLETQDEDENEEEEG